MLVVFNWIVIRDRWLRFIDHLNTLMAEFLVLRLVPLLWPKLDSQGHADLEQAHEQAPLIRVKRVHLVSGCARQVRIKILDQTGSFHMIHGFFNYFFEVCPRLIARLSEHFDSFLASLDTFAWRLSVHCENLA